MRHILLVRPSNEHEMSDWTYDGIERLLGRKSAIAPLPLATIAALTPDSFSVRLWDEEVHGPIETSDALKAFDLVGITGFSSDLSRARKVARLARGAGVTVVIGGPGVTAAPETCREDFDVLFVGEAETTWPQYLADLEAGRPTLKEYRAETSPELSLSPPPRWDSIADVMGSYLVAGVQVSRGCPFNCEFCGVWQVFGRRMRTKPIPQVEQEIRTLAGFGFHSIMFCSDNFIGDPKYAKELLRHLIVLNREFDPPLSFAGELDLSIARNDELLSLLADANFSGLFIGIETPNRDSLAEARKRQNLRGDLVQNVHHVQSYGLPVEGSLVVGFDHDTQDTFDEMFDFVQEACIPLPKMHTLKAIPGTELYQRVKMEGRVVSTAQLLGRSSSESMDAGIYSNILPKKMSRAELFHGYCRLLERIFDWNNFEQRVRGFVAGITRPSSGGPKAPKNGYVPILRARFGDFPTEFHEPMERLISDVEKTSPRASQTVMVLLFRYVIAAERAKTVRQEIAGLMEQEGLLQGDGRKSA